MNKLYTGVGWGCIADFSNVQADHYLLSSTDTPKNLCLADAECIALYIRIFYNALA